MKRSADGRGQVVPFPEGGGNMRYLDPNASHARIYSEWRHLPAYKTLTPLQKVILLDILMNFTKAVGNEVRLTGNGVSQKYHVGHRTARAAIAALEERGWIFRIGFGPGQTGQAGGVYEILCMGPNGNRTAGPYQQWLPSGSGNRNSSVQGPN